MVEKLAKVDERNGRNGRPITFSLSEVPDASVAIRTLNRAAGIIRVLSPWLALRLQRNIVRARAKTHEGRMQMLREMLEGSRDAITLITSSIIEGKQRLEQLRELLESISAEGMTMGQIMNLFAEYIQFEGVDFSSLDDSAGKKLLLSKVEEAIEQIEMILGALKTTGGLHAAKMVPTIGQALVEGATGDLQQVLASTSGNLGHISETTEVIMSTSYAQLAEAVSQLGRTGRELAKDFHPRVGSNPKIAALSREIERVNQSFQSMGLNP